MCCFAKDSPAVTVRYVHKVAEIKVCLTVVGNTTHPRYKSLVVMKCCRTKRGVEDTAKEAERIKETDDTSRLTRVIICVWQRM